MKNLIDFTINSFVTDYSTTRPVETFFMTFLLEIHSPSSDTSKALAQIAEDYAKRRGELQKMEGRVKAFSDKAFANEYSALCVEVDEFDKAIISVAPKDFNQDLIERFLTFTTNKRGKITAFEEKLFAKEKELTAKKAEEALPKEPVSRGQSLETQLQTQRAEVRRQSEAVAAYITQRRAEIMQQAKELYGRATKAGSEDVLISSLEALQQKERLEDALLKDGDIIKRAQTQIPEDESKKTGLVKKLGEISAPFKSG